MTVTSSERDNANIESDPQAKQAEHPFITRLLLALIPSRWTYSTQKPLPSSRPPGYLARVLDAVLFTHCFPLIWSSALGRTLNENDFTRLPRYLHIKSKISIFQETFSTYARRENINGSRPSTFLLLRTLLYVFRWELLSGFGCRFLDIGSHIAQVLLYKIIIEFLLPDYHRDGPEPKGHGFGHGVGLLVANGIAIFVAQIFEARARFTMDMVGGQAKTLLATSIAEKSLDTTQWASQGEKTDVGTGEADSVKKGARSSNLLTGAVLNLANTDVERVQLGLRLLNDVWPIIMLVPLVGGLSYWLIGWPGLAALGFEYTILSCIIPLLFAMYKVRAKANIQTDMRVKLVNDLIHGIRLLKACAWEDIYIDALAAVRHVETKMNKIKMSLATWLMAFSFYSAAAAPLLGTALYSIHNDIRLTSSANLLCFVFIFIWLAEFYFVFSNSIVAVADAWQSLQRIQNFLVHEETVVEIQRHGKEDPSSSSATSSEKSLKQIDNALTLIDAQFSWSKQNSQTNDATFVLEPVTMSVKAGELLAITGPTSSGKTTLATCLAGLTFLNQGEVNRHSRPIYASISPWIHSGTVRSNILFGQDFRDDLYWEAVKSCQLELDFSQFPNSDMSYLGERGINLSGGQKARVGLARAVYASLIQAQTNDETIVEYEKSSTSPSKQRGIIIMDDPLSALDAATALAVFDNLIRGKLSGFTRILVTHQVQFLGRCDRVTWIEKGCVGAIEPYSELLDSNPSFKRFIGEMSQLEHEEIDEEENKEKMATENVYDRGDDIIEEEERQTHRIPWNTIGSYMRFRKYWPLFIVMGTIYIVSQTGNTLWTFFFAWWTSEKFNWSTGEWLALLLSAMAVQGTLWQITSYGTTLPLMTLSEATSNAALKGVLKAPMTFFDSNPSGRILNRFTQDVNSTDNILPPFFWQLGILGCYSLAAIGISIYYVNLIATILVPWLLIVVFYVLFYKPTPLFIKRIEAPLSSNVISTISEIVKGAPDIQVFAKARSLFLEKLYARVDDLNRVHLASYAFHAWISVYAAVLSIIFYLGVGLFALRIRRTLAPGIASALLVASLNLLWATQIFLYKLAETQRCFNCVERLHHYAHDLGTEREARTKGDALVSKDGQRCWPTKGKIELEHVDVRYKDGCPLALRDLSLAIEGGEKVGVVGRTGTGKSTLYSLLLGLVDPCSGSLHIDGINTLDIGLHDLREAIAIIPQEPTLFAGTVRSNLDPRSQYSNEELNRILQITGLQHFSCDAPRDEEEDEKEEKKEEELDRKDLEGEFEGKSPSSSSNLNLQLTTPLSPSGLNLSTGQRQLLSLARALVRNTRIILIDEATAMVDYRTDAKIQKLLSSEGQFRHVTVIAIAHRLTTVLGYDRIAVLDKGRVVEFGRPFDLWRNGGAVGGEGTVQEEGALGDEGGGTGNMFRELCDRAGVREAMFVRKE